MTAAAFTFLARSCPACGRGTVTVRCCPEHPPLATCDDLDRAGCRWQGTPDQLITVDA